MGWIKVGILGVVALYLLNLGLRMAIRGIQGLVGWFGLVFGLIVVPLLDFILVALFLVALVYAFSVWSKVRQRF
jgi:hypothetical protein